MTANEFRKIALALPEAVEGAHMDHPDFRVRGKIFATLRGDTAWGMVKLRPAQQLEFVHAEPDTFVPVAGAWGRRGATSVRLATVSPATLRIAMHAAWVRAAPKQLVDGHSGSSRKRRS